MFNNSKCEVLLNISDHFDQCFNLIILIMLIEQQHNGMQSEIKISKGNLWLLNNGRNSYFTGNILTVKRGSMEKVRFERTLQGNGNIE
jgi:hypothetical protein